MLGLTHPVLMCKQKKHLENKWRGLHLDGACENFYPSTDSRLTDQAARRIPLARDKFIIVDAADYYWLAQYRWFIENGAKTSYASRRYNGKRIKMHREIMNAPANLVVDHIDHNGLNNCRSNLRLCSLAQNNCNRLSIRGGTSKYKGISWSKTRKRWIVKIQLNQKTYHIGQFKNEIDAAKAYDKRAKELHGQFACLNFPTKQKNT